MRELREMKVFQDEEVISRDELARLRRVEAAAKAVNAAFLRGDGIMDVAIDNLSAALEDGV